MKYRIEYSPVTENHFRALTPQQRKIVLDAVDKQLTHQPDITTRNRKPMRPNPLSIWELRVGNLRIYYDIEKKPECKVFIRAIGIKDRNIIKIGKEIIKL